MTPADLDALDALAAAATTEDPEWYVPDRAKGYHIRGTDLRYIAALSPDVVRELVADARLGAAWRAAEGALPEGWHLVLSSSPDAGHDAYARNPASSLSWDASGTGPTPAAALLSLAEALRGRVVG